MSLHYSQARALNKKKFGSGQERESYRIEITAKLGAAKTDNFFSFHLAFEDLCRD
jgi:hypothetical protein